MADRLDLHWHSRSGPEDLAGFCGVYPVARAYLDCRSGLWLWSASWLAGIDPGVPATAVRGPSPLPKRPPAAGRRWRAAGGMMEAGMDREAKQREEVAEKLAAALDAIEELRMALAGPAGDRGAHASDLDDPSFMARTLSGVRAGEDLHEGIDRIEAYLDSLSGQRVPWVTIAETWLEETAPRQEDAPTAPGGP